MARKKVTQRKIAEMVGVSRNTVSKALNNDYSVSEQLRNTIRNTAIELGYQKLMVIDEGGGIYRKNIALVSVGNILGDSYWNTFLVNFEKRLRKLQYNMTFYFLGEEEEKKEMMPANLSASYVAGIVFIGVCTKEFATKLMELSIPTVFVDTFWDVDVHNLFADTIMVDNYYAEYQMTEYLIKNGHKKIGFSGDVYTCKSFYERWLGYKQALLDYNISYDQTICAMGSNIPGHYTSGTELYKKFKQMKKKPTAMVCCNDGCAIDFMVHLKEDGYLVPEDIAVAGFDNLKETTYFYPTLSTVEVHREHLGKRAADQIVKRITEPLEPFELIRLPAIPIYRDSTKNNL